jgi:hypothetical protein
LGIGDWGLGIGPNPQSPIPIFIKVYFFAYKKYFEIMLICIFNKIIVKIFKNLKLNVYNFSK